MNARSGIDRQATGCGDRARGCRVLMSVDAVGGVWRYAMDLAGGLRREGCAVVFAGFGPPPSDVQAAEASAIGTLVWLDADLDWTGEGEERLDRIPALIERLVRAFAIDLVHLNAPSQAAGLDVSVPVVAVSHSCVVTWFEAVRGSGVPESWAWHERRNRHGFERADVVIAPSRSHADALRRCYGPVARLEVLHNACALPVEQRPRQAFALAAARWWDEGKNGAALDRAAAQCRTPVLMAGAFAGPEGSRFEVAHARVLGELPHAQVAALMESAAIFVSPSLYEPFGLAALEAARKGAALVLADIATYRELWDGAALFANPKDPGAIAAAVDRLSDDPRLRSRLAQHAGERALQFSLEHQCRQALDVYARALERPQRIEAAE
ncbi:glycosyltransferase involved in cell wall biosynthesis [Mycoplana sp. BE70]|nr:glycosyltransferase family 4 protein [Mycoplana sp. BE70]MDR6758655.1 glycosyltransferase involved in cell wall biosynthesis [Mycoplana sp. BE70]